MKKKFEDIFVIPTHRNVKMSMKSIIKEMYVSNGDKALVVLDNSKSEIFKENHIEIKKESGKCKYPIFHVGINDMEKIVYKISESLGERDTLIELLVPYDFDYGKIFNMIYLIAEILGADRIHRRDSDCYYSECTDINEYAVVEENKYLGEKIHNVLDKIDVLEKKLYSMEEEICIVGSDYVGNWNLDLNELMNSSDAVARKLLELCEVPKESVDMQIEEIYSDNNKKYKKPILKNTFRIAKVPECGNVSMTKIYKYLPNLVGKNGVGFDYFTYFISFLYDVPIIYHSNTIQHIHDKKRYEDVDLYNYWVGVYKMIDLDIVYTNIIKSERISKINNGNLGLEAIIKTIPSEFSELFWENASKIDENDRNSKFESIIEDILKASGIEKYVNVGKRLNKNCIYRPDRAHCTAF